MIKVNIFFGFKLFVTVTILTTPITMQAITSRLVATSKLKTTYTLGLPLSTVKTDNFQLSSSDGDIRQVNFTNDLGEVVELDLICQYESLGIKEKKCLAHFEEIPITIRAEKEYHVKNGDKINVETKNSWELSIQKISNDALLSLKTFRDLVLDQFMPKKRIANFMDEWVWTPWNRAKLFIYQKVIARHATTTITIHTDIEEHHKSVRCSDIILDLDKLAGENKLEISIDHESLLNMNVIIKPIKHGSLSNRFF